MGKKLQTSRDIFNASLRVIRNNSRLLIFPAVIAAFTLAIGLFFIAPIVLQPTGYGYHQIEHWKAVWATIPTGESKGQTSSEHKNGQLQFFHSRPLLLTPHGKVYLAGIYLVSMVLATFFNVAFCSQIFNALDSRPVSIRAGLLFALSRWQAILLWALLAAFVGLLIKRLEERFSFIGSIVLKVVGMAWSVAAVFAIPVLIREKNLDNPLQVLRQSTSTIRKTWGETLIGWVGLQIVSSWVVLGLSIVLFYAGFALTEVLSSAWPIVIVGAAWFMAMLAFATLSSGASQVYKSVLYLYASTGNIPQTYDRSMMDVAWKSR